MFGLAMPRRTPLVPWAALALALLVPAVAGARDWRAGPLTLGDPWARPALAGRNGAGYLSIANAGKAADTLTGAASPAAAKVTLHEMRMTGAVMSMRPVASLPIPAGGHVALAPGGYHLMLEGLKRELKAGQRVPVTLTFARAGKVAVELEVRAPAPAHSGHM